MTVREIQAKFHMLPALDIDVLLAGAIKKPKEFLYSSPKYKLSWIESIRFNFYISKYRRGYSVAAILKHKEFLGLDFFVNKHVLIPRPDTEVMAEEAIGLIKHELEAKKTDIIYIDVGTGSGCIPISVSHAIPKLSRIFAIDISAKALTVSKKNARTYNAPIQFFHGSLLEPLLKKQTLLGTPCFMVITANLPYLSEAQFKSEPSIQREPKIALVAEHNGLAAYNSLLSQIRTLPPVCQLFILLEIDPSQTAAIIKLIQNHLPYAHIEIKKDLSGFDRLVVIKLQG